MERSASEEAMVQEMGRLILTWESASSIRRGLKSPSTNRYLENRASGYELSFIIELEHFW